MTADNLRPLPGDLLRTTPVPDDSGAETADRYEWQAMMAAADVLALYFEALDAAGRVPPGSSFTVLCEHHEDWSVIQGKDTEIVSAKHREPSNGPFSTYRQLLNEGGVLHLFERWHALKQTPTCRLVTTSGLRDAGAKTARVCDRLRADTSVRDDEIIAVIDGFMSTIGSLWPKDRMLSSPLAQDTICAFLTSLRFQTGEARRDQLPDMAGARYGEPVAVRLGCPGGGFAVWRAVLALVRPCMRAAGPSDGGALPVVTGVQHDEPLATRTLTLDDVDTAIHFALGHISGYVQLPRVIKANLMAVKMTRGGCSDNAIERADELRLQYRRYWRARNSIPSISDTRRSVENTLLRVIDEATEAVRDEGQWGARLWRELSQRLACLEGMEEGNALDAELLLGGVSELAYGCRAWYTDRFDAPLVLRRLTTGRAAS